MCRVLSSRLSVENLPAIPVIHGSGMYVVSIARIVASGLGLPGGSHNTRVTAVRFYEVFVGVLAPYPPTIYPPELSRYDHCFSEVVCRMTIVTVRFYWELTSPKPYTRDRKAHLLLPKG